MSYLTLSANGETGLSMKEPNPIRNSSVKSLICSTTKNEC